MDKIQVQYEADLSKLKAQLGQLENELRGVDKEAKKSADNLDRNFNNATKGVNNLNATITKLTPILAGVFAVDRIIAFGQSIVETTGKFQRFEAVLTNTLGSRSAAQQALALIQEFAATTPFQVDELTASFVKLANQGFIPTRDEMRKLGDLAASTGKSFDMLTEAIIDAQTGEFERLKEFGIRASKEGDRVTFTFKGIKTQTDFTNKSIRDYILSLGDLKGVSGGMAAQSQTLEGQLSNLEDTITDLKKTIGDALAPAISAVVNGVRNLVGSVKEVKVLGFAFEALIAPIKVAFDLLGEAYNTIIKPIVDVLKAAFVPMLEALNKAFGGVGGSVSELMAKFNPLILTIRLALLPVQLLAKGLSLLTPIINDYIVPAFQEFVVLLAQTRNGIADFVNGLTQSGLAKSIQSTFGFEIGKVGKINIEELRKSFKASVKDQIASTNELDKVRKEAEDRAKQGQKELTEFEKIQAAERERIRKQEIKNFIKTKENAARIYQELLGFNSPAVKNEISLTKVTKEEADKRKQSQRDSFAAFRKMSKELSEQNEQDLERAVEKELYAESVKEEARERAVELVADAGTRIIDILQEQENIKTEIELEKNQERTNNELIELERKRTEGLISEDLFLKQKTNILTASKKREADIKTKDAQNDKKLALFKIAVETAAAVVKQLAAVPLPVGAPLLATVIALGALQAGTVLATPIPKFAKGVSRFKGKGSNTSDSNIVAISNNESIVTAKASMQFEDEITAMNKGYFKKHIDKNYVIPALRRVEAERSRKEQNMANNMASMVKVMKANEYYDGNIIRAIKNKDSYKISNAKEIAREILKGGNPYNL